MITHTTPISCAHVCVVQDACENLVKLVAGVAEANMMLLVGVSDSTPPEESDNCTLMLQTVLVSY